MLTTTLRRLRESRAAEFEGEGEAGFTLIELMVVLLIIAILLAIAIPTFLGVTGSANDRAAQSNLTNALTEASAIYQSNAQSFTGTNASVQAQFTSQAPEFAWTVGTNAITANNGTGIGFSILQVSVTQDAQGIVLTDYSKNNATCWYAVQLNAAPVAAVLAANLGSSTAFNTGAALTAGGAYYAKSASQPTGCTTTSAAAYNTWFASYSSVTTTN